MHIVDETMLSRTAYLAARACLFRGKADHRRLVTFRQNFSHFRVDRVGSALPSSASQEGG
jgi:hypothetical protein